MTFSDGFTFAFIALSTVCFIAQIAYFTVIGLMQYRHDRNSGKHYRSEDEKIRAIVRGQ